ncbi:MAG: hypothetical protein GVY28_02410, partial [Alphaproteobacteria bacterium]|nr:hypothetical protein [Alphaproteobacteria bacterium]
TETGRKQGDRGDHQGLSRAKAQRGKNLAVLFALIAFVALIYIVAIVRMGGNG